MKRVVLVALSLLLLAATPDEVLSALEEQGFYIEAGSAATEEVVSDAVFQGRADGGRLYIVVLSEEPSGGAPTFSDSVLDLLGAGYVVTVAPETVGYAGDSTFWDAGEMDQAVQASLGGNSDDEVVQLLVSELTGGAAPAPGGDDGESDSGGFGSGWIWLVVLGGGALLVWAMMRNGAKKRSVAAAAELDKVRGMARSKLADIANDILEMEDEVQLSDNPEVKAHYERASTTYTETLARMNQDPGPGEMVDVVKDLDLAIWELDAAEALLDGKPVPDKPKPPEPAPPVRQPEQAGPEVSDDYGRRPQRQSRYAGNEMMTALWAILALSGRGGGWGGGGFGGPMRGGGGRMRGGGMRMGGFGGRMRGGGRR